MLSVSNLSKVQGGELLYSQVSFQINPGEKVGLVGPNGAGKTTLFRMIVGEERPDEGQISLAEKVRISYFSQNVGDMKGKSALQEVVEGDDKVRVLQEKLRFFETKLEEGSLLSDDEINDVLVKMGDAQTEFEKIGGYDLETRAQEILTGLGIAPLDHQKPVQDFSGGWKMRIALAKALVTAPDLVIMDEPTNYLDMETILWLEVWLKNFKGAVLMTTHDRDFMNNVVKKIVELGFGNATVYSGNYDFYLKEKAVRMEQRRAGFERQQDMLAKEEDFIARFKARASHAAQVQSRVKKLDKIDRIELPPEEETLSFEFPVPPRGGDDVVVIENLGKAWVNSKGEQQQIFKNLTATIKRQEKIAVVGINGAGKSTLLQVINGLTSPSQGLVKIGPSVKMGYFGQKSFEELNPERTIFEEIRTVLNEASDGFLRNLLASFLFRGDDVKKKIKFLSGGEKSRVILAKILSLQNNLLVLDEPTNHLDIKSREMLLDHLKKFEGTVLFVSHDRHFLHHLSEKVFEVDRGAILIFPGNYEYYLSTKVR